MDDESSWQRQVLIGLVVLVAVGTLIGGIVALLSIKAADLAGIDDAPSTGDPFAPDRTRDPETGAASDGPITTGPTTGAETTGPTTSAPAPEQSIVLSASPESVAAYERVNLTGTATAPPGTMLQLERKEGGAWVAFPIDPVSISGGTFSTYIETGRAGMNIFRMRAVGRGQTSNDVRIQVG
jgi:hypothetical protein